MTSLPSRTSRAGRRPWPAVPLLLGLAMPLPLLWLTIPAAQAESRTAESIWSQDDAQRQAIDQIPVADRKDITQTRCQQIGTGMGSLPRYRCTVWFTPRSTPAAPAAPATPAAPTRP